MTPGKDTKFGRYRVPDPQGESADDWPELLDSIWHQQEFEIQGSVATHDDLPAPDPDAETDDGQRRRVLVVEQGIVYRDDGSQWEPIYGVGLIEEHADEPDVHHDEDHADRHSADGPDPIHAVDLASDPDEDEGRIIEADGEGGWQYGQIAEGLQEEEVREMAREEDLENHIRFGY